MERTTESDFVDTCGSYYNEVTLSTIVHAMRHPKLIVHRPDIEFIKGFLCPNPTGNICVYFEATRPKWYSASSDCSRQNVMLHRTFLRTLWCETKKIATTLRTPVNYRLWHIIEKAINSRLVSSVFLHTNYPQRIVGIQIKLKGQAVNVFS